MTNPEIFDGQHLGFLDWIHLPACRQAGILTFVIQTEGLSWQ